jgi:uncharacterized protein (DUF111 family)
VVETPYGPVRVKVLQGPGSQQEEYRPEYEDCREIAEREGIPLRRVYETLSRILDSGMLGEGGAPLKMRGPTQDR